jgi:dTDP-4-dehydrorhamnose 3,5-epimerase
MLFSETKIPGAWILDIEPMRDERGFFARTWCRDELTRRGLRAELVQCSVSYNARRGTLRGMHFQVAPHAETKIVSCLRGSIYDVLLDLRRESPTYCQWIAVELTEQSFRAVYIPEGVAHGFQTLTDDAVVSYQMSEMHSPGHAHGVRWSDPAFAIEWPETTERILSPRDRAYPEYVP